AVSSRSAIALRHRTMGKPIVIEIRLADGRIHDQSGTLNFFDTTVAATTDTITLRGDVRNPLAGARMDGRTRELVDGEYAPAILPCPVASRTATVTTHGSSGAPTPGEAPDAHALRHLHPPTATISCHRYPPHPCRRNRVAAPSRFANSQHRAAARARNRELYR